MANEKIKIIRKFHRWASIILGVQVLFWVAGGLVMSVLPIDQVRGNHLVNDRGQTPVALSSAAGLSRVLNNQSKYSSVAAFDNSDFRYFVVSENESEIYLDATTGDKLPQLDEQTAIKLAQRYLVDSTDVKAATLATFDSPDTRGIDHSVWRIEFDDAIATTLYLHPNAGHLIRVRSNLWRIFDFVWMLHIMDYDERTDFNHPLLIIFACSALLFVLAGMALLIDMLRRQRVRRINQKNAPA